MKGVLPWLLRWAQCAGRRGFCPALAALDGPVQNIFPSPYTISIHLSPYRAGLPVSVSLSLGYYQSAYTENVRNLLPFILNKVNLFPFIAFRV
jgi:hypothetical protein